MNAAPDIEQDLSVCARVDQQVEATAKSWFYRTIYKKDLFKASFQVEKTISIPLVLFAVTMKEQPIFPHFLGG